MSNLLSEILEQGCIWICRRVDETSTVADIITNPMDCNTVDCKCCFDALPCDAVKLALTELTEGK